MAGHHHVARVCSGHPRHLQQEVILHDAGRAPPCVAPFNASHSVAASQGDAQTGRPGARNSNNARQERARCHFFGPPAPPAAAAPLAAAASVAAAFLATFSCSAFMSLPAQRSKNTA